MCVSVNKFDGKLWQASSWTGLGLEKTCTQRVEVQILFGWPKWHPILNYDRIKWEDTKSTTTYVQFWSGPLNYAQKTLRKIYMAHHVDNERRSFRINTYKEMTGLFLWMYSLVWDECLINASSDRNYTGTALLKCTHYRKDIPKYTTLYQNLRTSTV